MSDSYKVVAKYISIEKEIKYFNVYQVVRYDVFV